MIIDLSKEDIENIICAFEFRESECGVVDYELWDKLERLLEKIDDN